LKLREERRIQGSATIFLNSRKNLSFHDIRSSAADKSDPLKINTTKTDDKQDETHQDYNGRLRASMRVP
jgi:hypothetical protein